MSSRAGSRPFSYEDAQRMRPDELAVGTNARELVPEREPARRVHARCDRCGYATDEYGTCLKAGIHITH